MGKILKWAAIAFLGYLGIAATLGGGLMFAIVQGDIPPRPAPRHARPR